MSLPYLQPNQWVKPRQHLFLDTSVANHGHSRESSLQSISQSSDDAASSNSSAAAARDREFADEVLTAMNYSSSSMPLSNHSSDRIFGHMTEQLWTSAARHGQIDEIRRLGEGSGGAVSLCRLRLAGSDNTAPFALKEIPANPDNNLRKQILRELQFNQSCGSPYITQYYGAYLLEEVGSIFIAMEFCGGGSLDMILRRTQEKGARIGERVLARVAESVLQGICYLYDRNIIHRDIKPQNILLTRDGDVKLCDFGVSGKVVNSLATTFTGTSYYMAPERIRGQPYTVTSDVWSLGLTLLELAQGHFPFQIEGAVLTPIELLSSIVNMPPPELSDEPGIKWSEAFRHFIKSCLEKDPSARPSPKKMLNHPWIVGHRKLKVDMAKFVDQCWQN